MSYVFDSISCCVFFFKQKTAYEIRISDWSSDVCSSDLDEDNRDGRGQDQPGADERPGAPALRRMKLEQHETGQREDEADEGEDVDEPAPRGARVAALMTVVEIGNPTTVADFAHYRPGLPVDRHPAPPAGAWHGQLNPVPP